jgi:phosphatidylglycerophosphate synthase
MYFDYADGITARRYNQTTKLGDWYDHIVDIFGFTIPLLIVLSLPRDRWLYLVPVIIFMIATVINIGCIEKSYNKQTDGNGGDSLKIAEKLCFAPEVFRWLDNSVLYIVIIVIIILYSHA